MADLFTEAQLRDQGRDRVEMANETWLPLARREAVRICAQHGRVSVSEIRDWAEATGIRPRDPLAYSAVFKGKEWKPTGQMVPSRHQGGHARRVMYWTYESTVYP